MNILKLWLLSVIVVPFSLDSAYLGSGYLKTGLMSFSPSFDLAEDGKSLLTRIENFQKQDLSDWQGISIHGREITYFNKDYTVAKKVILPFKYLYLTQEAIEKIYFVSQNRMVVVENDETALIAPLSPCLGIFVTLPDQSKTLAIHIDVKQSEFYTITAIEDFLSKNNVTKEQYCNVKIFIYTTKPQEEEFIKKQKRLLGSLLGIFYGMFAKQNVGFYQVDTTYSSPMRFEDDSSLCAPVYANATASIVATAKSYFFNTCFLTEAAKYLPDAKKTLPIQKFFRRKDYHFVVTAAAFYKGIGAIANFLKGPVFLNKSGSTLGQYLTFQVQQTKILAACFRKDDI